MALVRLLAFADNDVTSGAKAVLSAMMKVPDVAEYDFVGDGPYSESGTAWCNMMGQYFNTEALKDKLRISQGNHEDKESESEQTQADIENWYKRGLKESKWLSAGQRGNVYIISLNTQDMDVEFKRDQYNWVVTEINKAKQLRASGQIDWIVTMCHKPWFTLKSSHSPYTAVRKIYNDLFIEAGVDFMLHGHNHNNQLWYPMEVDFSTEANGLGKQLFTYAADGKTFDFSKKHGVLYIVAGHAGHEWNKINDTGEGVKNVMHHRSSGKFGFVQLDFNGKNATVQSVDSDLKVLYEYKVTREGSVTPPPDSPIAKLTAPSQVAAGQKVTLDASGSSGYDTLEIMQTLGELVQLSSVGTNKKEFIAPLSASTNFQLGFKALAIKGAKQSTADVSIQVVSVPPPDGQPVASFTMTPSNPKPNTTIELDSSASQGNIISRQWRITDQLTIENPTATQTRFNIQNKLSVDVTLTVTDNNGLTATSTQTINTTQPPPPPPESGKLVPVSIAASGQDLGREASKAADGDMESRWVCDGDGAWIEFKFDKAYPITKVKLTAFDYNKTYKFEINGKQFESVAGRPPNQLQDYDLRDLNINSDTVRIIGHGNNTTTYNSFREIEFYTEADPRHCPPNWHFDETLKKCIPDLEPTINPNPTPNKPPVAKAGADQTVKPNTTVTLNGSGSSDPDGNQLTFQWAQTAGTPVNIANANKAVATFTAPSVVADDEAIARLTLPSTAQAGQTDIIADASGSVADNVEITETTSEGITLSDAGQWKKKFNIPNKSNFSIGIQAKAIKGTKQAVVQKSIQVSGNNPPTGEVDSLGIKWIAAKGAQTMIKQTRDEADDDRWSGNYTGLKEGMEATMIAKSIGVASDGHFAMKHGGGNHSGSGASSQRWYDTGLRSNGQVQLQWEGPHPSNHSFSLPDSKYFIKSIGKPLEGNWIGLKWILQTMKPGASPADGGIRCRMYVDRNAIVDGKPANNWELVYDFIDGVDAKVLSPQTYKMPDEMDCEIRRSGHKSHEVYGGGLHVRRLGASASAFPEIDIDSAGQPQSIIAAAVPQTLTFQLRVTDTKGASNTDSINVTVADDTQPPPPENPVAKLTAPANVTGGQSVILDGSQSIADTLTISQTSGQTVNLVDAGTFKKQFTAPTGNFQLAFQAVAVKGGKQAITQVSIQVSTNQPPPPPTGKVLWDSNIHMKVDKITTVKGTFGDQKIDGKGFYTAASGSPRCILYPDGKFELEADSGHGRIYIKAKNYNARLEGELMFVDSNLDNTTWKLRNRHGMGGDCQNRFGGIGGVLERGVAGSGAVETKIEKCHNEHESGQNGSLPKAVNAGQWIGFKYSVYDTPNKDGIVQTMEIDYKDGKGFIKVLDATFKNPPAYYVDRNKFMENSEYWIRINNSKTGKVAYKNVRLIEI